MGNKVAREFRGLAGHDSDEEHQFQKGDKVEALFHGKVWAPGKIESVNEDGTYVIEWASGSKEDKIKKPDQVIAETEADHSLLREKMNLEAAFRELHGIHELKWLGLLAVLGSCGIIVFGARHSGLSFIEQMFMVLAAAFLIKTTLSATTTMRNSSWQEVQDHRGRPLAGERLIEGECVGGWMSYVSFFIAIACSCYGVWLMDLTSLGEFQDKMLFIFGFLVLICSVTVVSVTLRDQGDAAIWMCQAAPQGSHTVPHTVVAAVTRNLVVLARSSRLRMIVLFSIASIVSMVLWIVGLTQYPISPHRTGITFMIMAYVFLLLCTAALARAIEIEEDSHPNTSGNQPIRRCNCCCPPKSVLFTMAAWLVAAGVTAWGFTRTHAHFYALRMLVVGLMTSCYTVFHLVIYCYKGRTVDHIDTSPHVDYVHHDHH